MDGDPIPRIRNSAHHGAPGVVAALNGTMAFQVLYREREIQLRIDLFDERLQRRARASQWQREGMALLVDKGGVKVPVREHVRDIAIIVQVRGVVR